MKFTAKEKATAELTLRSLSKKARIAYGGQDAYCVAEKDGDLYLIETGREAEKITLPELEEFFADEKIFPTWGAEKDVKEISLDNGSHYMTAEEAMPEIEEKGLWDVVAEYMEDDAREKVNNEIAPCTELEFLKKYLEIATEDLVIG